MKQKKIWVGVLTVVVVFVLAFVFLSEQPVSSQGFRRLQLQDRHSSELEEGGWAGFPYRIATICDTATGNLLYVHHPGGIAVVPGGCSK